MAKHKNSQKRIDALLYHISQLEKFVQIQDLGITMAGRQKTQK